MEAVEDTLKPVKKGIHRIKCMKSEIYLKYINREVTECSYSAAIDFGGNMPDWLINIINKRLPYEVLSKLKRECRKEKYLEKSKLSSIKRKIEKAIEDNYLQH
jgi:hypothetical protein